MHDKLKILLDKMNMSNEYYNQFNDGKIIKLKLDSTRKNGVFVIGVKNVIEKEVISFINENIKGAFPDMDSMALELVVDNLNYDDVINYYKDAIENSLLARPMKELFKEKKVSVSESILTIEIDNRAEENIINKNVNDILKYFHRIGFSNLSINYVINEENQTLVKKELEKALVSNTVDIPKKESPLIYGDESRGNITLIKDIIMEEANIVVDAFVFGVDEFESKKSNFKIITLKISDNTDSIYAKFFTKDEDAFKKVSKGVKKGEWYRFSGYVKEDKFDKDLVLNLRSIMKIPSKNNSITDDAKEKRIELHAHTKMSQMDGVVDAKTLVKQAIKWGHKAIGITDHNGVQSFPDVYHTVRDYNKGKPLEEHFKALYGCELTMVDDTIRIVVRPTDDPILDITYVVFDLETTGFNAGGGDSIIEIGAVKIRNGEIIDKFDQLINPGHKLNPRITEVTSITDAMLVGKPNEEEAVKNFIGWTGDLPMVAHNAKFDTSFIEMAYQKYNLGTYKNTVIDTLELSRTLDTNYARHSLSAIVKRYDVPFDEESHHRGDYDAEATALVLHKMLKKLSDRNFETIRDIDKLVSKDEIHKYGRTYHVNLIAKNRDGLKNLFKIISLANTKYLYKTPRILRSEIESKRNGILVGSGCYESEVFTEARSKSDEELTNIINFYDYVEVQPPEVYDHLLQMGDFSNKEELIDNIKKVIKQTKDAGKLIVATGDVHQLTRDDKIYREIIVNQKVPGGGRHPLAKRDITSIPSQHFRTTNEMFEDFSFLSKEEAYELIITNPNLIADQVEEIEVIIETGGVPFSPRVKSDDGSSYLDCPKVVTELVYDKAASWYGNPLPYNIEERISMELYGNIVYKACSESIKKSNPNISDKELEKEAFKFLHDTVVKGFDSVKELLAKYVKENWNEEDGEITDDSVAKRIDKELGGIIGGGFDPIYLIAQRLVKHSNDDGYLVGSRGSVGSSFVATMMGITEVNPLPAHYRCLKCQTSIFNDDDGNPLGETYSTGFDLPDKNCPNCNEPLYKDGQDMPFATFLGFNADKVPDIDLNFSDLNQASAHAYTKVLFGADNVYRAGTIGTVAEKTAYGFVKGYLEEKGLNKRAAEVERLAMGCTGIKRTTGQHPGGIVVIPDYMEVFDFTPFQFPAEDPTQPWRTTHFDYHAIDECVLKLDILGHSDPTQLRMIQDLTGTDITKVPLDDKDTMSIFTSTKALGVTNEQILCNTGTLGIPEFGTPFTIAMVAETKPTTFAELIKISGLSHGTDVWVGNAQELIKNKIVPFKDVIGCRDDIMVYLMYNGVKPITAFKIMEFVRKGKASYDHETWKIHKQTMEEANIPDWYIESCGKIKYMFPKAHAAAYVISAFRIAWYKVHMPVYFYASWFTSKATDVDVDVMIKGYDAIKEKIIEIQNKGYEASNKEQGQLESLKVALEATARGIKFLPIDLYKSNATTWGVKDETSIYPPFSSIDGLGDTVAVKIVEERQKGDFISIEDLQIRGKVSGTLIDKMRLMKILDNMPESSQLSLF